MSKSANEFILPTFNREYEQIIVKFITETCKIGKHIFHQK